jgi:hypothetical protein
MSQRSRKPAPIEDRPLYRRPVFWLAAGILLVLAAVTWGVIRDLSADTGSPQLVVDQEQIDFGDVQFGQPVTATFTLTNQGSAPLRFSAEPWIEIREGC